MYEKDCFSTEVLTSLQQKGHTLEERKGPSGRVDAILVKEDGFLQGGADPRGDDTAIGIR
jgi:gamma-glutamyltranspeptidase/glutathione hydrolase